MTVSDFVKTKTEYEAIPVPEELNGRLTETLARGQRQARRRRRLHHLLSAASTAAVLCLFAAVNLSAPFAKAMQSLPVVGPVFRVITFRQYTDDSGNYGAEIAVPQIADSDPSTPLEDSLAQMNQALSGYADSIIAQYEADLAAGGDLGHEYVYSDFQVLRDSDRLLSVCIRTDIVMASTNSFVKIYHLDKTAGQLIELSDLFQPGSGYVERLSGLVKQQMRSRMAKDPSQSYFIDQNSGLDFTSIRPDQSFYINADGALVLVFDKYEAAPGYMGVVEFTIPLSDIQDLAADHSPLLAP